MFNIGKSQYYVLATCLLAIVLSSLATYFLFQKNETLSQKAIAAKISKEESQRRKLHFQLIDPEEAAEPLLQYIEKGYQIMLHTPEYLPEYATGKLSCTNCHFNGGDTLGGYGAGISLAGSAAQYPKYHSRLNKIQDFPGRINECFERSMNGRPLPLNSPEMLSIICYLQWISKGIPIYQKLEWLGLPPVLSSKHVYHAENGKQIYETKCAICHGEMGEGKLEDRIPPIWGENSFNDGAGMHDPQTLSSFIYFNMPYNEPHLSIEDAIDVSTFILEQNFPHFK